MRDVEGNKQHAAFLAAKPVLRFADTHTIFPPGEIHSILSACRLR